MLSYAHRPPHVPWEDDATLAEGDTVGELKVLHVPGHTPGHLAFFWRDRAMFVGDAILTWPSLGPGWPGFNLDEAEYRRSLRRIVTMEPEIVGPGHGSPVCDHATEQLAPLIR